jgi:L-cysteine desulfidase
VWAAFYSLVHIKTEANLTNAINIDMKYTWNQIVELLHREVKPALGCTEPIAVALAVAKSCERLRETGEEPEIIDIEVSANLLKNAMGVTIPGIGMVGLPVAASIAKICGKSQYGLEVLKDLKQEDIPKIQEFIDRKTIAVNLSKEQNMLYISAIVKSEHHTARTVIQDIHDNIVLEEVDGKILFKTEEAAPTSAVKVDENNDNQEFWTNFAKDLTIEKIWMFCQEVDFDKIEFVLETASMNKALAIKGLTNDYGLRVGKTIQKRMDEQTFGKGLLTRAMSMTAAASDARMAGCPLPAMSNSGSGNQGITVSMPVVAAAEQFFSEPEQLARALTLSHLIAIHIKSYLGRLSALCGCVVASSGAACGLVFLENGNLQQTIYAIKNMIGNITGMVCDGAKGGCALKVASGTASAVQSAILALDNICISENDGIIEQDIEKTIQNMAEIGAKGMKETDKLMLEMMICK